MAAANEKRGHLVVEVGDRKLTFAFSTNALCELEEAFDLPDITKLETILGDKPSMRTIRTLFRIGLTDCQPDMDDKEAGDIMNEIGGLEPSLEIIMRAISVAFPEAKPGGTTNPRKRPGSGRGTGRNST